MPHPLDGAHLRCERADIHLTEAQKLLRVWEAQCVDNIVTDDDGNAISFGAWPEVPLLMPLVISDAVHNLRAALDYVVFELAREDSGQIQHGTQFLIEGVPSDATDKRRGFKPKSKKCLAGFNQRHIDAIEALQPYNGTTWTETLRDISNPDKHRQLTVLSPKNRDVLAAIRVREGGRFNRPLPPRIDGPRYEHYDIEVNAIHTIAIPGMDQGIIPVLRAIEGKVFGVIDSFKPDFKI
jgi:hypothetical protein